MSEKDNSVPPLSQSISRLSAYIHSYPPSLCNDSETLDGDLESPTMNCHREPTLDGILSDPIVRAVMEADCVNPLELEEMLRQVAQRLRIPSGQHQGGLTRQF